MHTARTLESRVPSVSSIDRDHIIREMNNGSLFPSITDDNLRESILQGLLRLDVVIPTLRTFHENMKQFEIGVKILKTLLLDKRVRSEDTLYSTLTSKLRPGARFQVECSEGKFQSATLANLKDEQPWLLYTQLFLSAFRNFPFLSDFKPRIDPGQEEGIGGKIDPVCKFQFQEGAKLVGYETEKINKGLESTVEPLVVDSGPCLPLGVYGEGLERRCGRPFASSFQHFRTRLFLPNLREYRSNRGSLEPSVMFVQQDFINAFFGPIPDFTI
jgi:hypothetical protein